MEWDSWNKMKVWSPLSQPRLGLCPGGCCDTQVTWQAAQGEAALSFLDKNADCGGGIVRSHPKLRLAQQPHPKISCKWLKLLSLDGLCWSPDLELGIVTGLYQMSLPVWWLHCQPAWPSFPLLLSLFWWHCCCLLPLLWLETILSAAAIWFPCSTITGCDYHHCRSTLGARRIY